MPIGPKRLPFFEHIAELRWRLAVVLGVLTAGATVLYVDPFYTWIMDWLLAPIRQFLPGGHLNGPAALPGCPGG